MNNRVAEHTRPYDEQIADAFGNGYGWGVYDTMKKHNVSTDPTEAAKTGHRLYNSMKERFLKVFYSHGDVLMVDPED